MNRSSPRPPAAHLAPRSTGAMVIAALLLASGCAGTSPRDPNSPAGASAPNAGQSPREHLEALAKRQETTPDTKAGHAPPPPGFDTAQLAPLPDAEIAPGAKATQPLAEVLQRLVPTPASGPSKGDAGQTADPAALREYIIGRTALLSGKAAEAMNHLENASKLDPASGIIWRELAEAQSLAGRRASAVASYQRSLRSGNREPRVLRALGRDAWRAERADEAAALLGESVQATLASGESIWPPAGVDLGHALLKLGYLHAGAEVLEASLADAPTQIAQSRDRLELGEVLRRRSELWTIVGDTWAKIRQPERATRAWEAAFNAPGSDALGLLSRRVFTEMRAGRSAIAAISTLDLLTSDEGVIDERLLPLLHDIGEHSSLGESWPKAVAALGGPQATPSNRSRLARAAAASTPDAEAAREVLLAALRQHPFDAALLDALMPLRDTADVSGRVSDLEEVVRSSPLSADLCARALLFDGRRVDEALARLKDSGSPPARLILAASLDKLGHAADALSIVTKRDFNPTFAPAAAALRASLGAELARPEEISTAIAELAPLAPQSPEARRALAMSLEIAQRAGDALATLSPDIAPDAHPTCTVLLQAADLANQQQDPAQAQSLLERAIATDKFDERAYAPLLGLLTGPNASDQRAANLVRSLRDNVPNSRLIRLLQGRELASRSLWPQAETLLLGLMTENSEDADALGLLATVWERAYSATPDASRKGLEWLQARLANRPDSPPLIAATARVLAATGKAAVAESLLTPPLAKWPIADLSRLREAIVRDALGQPDRADDLAKARLAAAPPTPENSFELAQLLLRKGDTGGAIQALRRGFPDAAAFSIENGRRIVAILSGLKPDTLAKASPIDAEAAVGLFDLVVKRGVPMSPQLHGTRLTLLAAAAPNDATRLADAADEVAKSLPEARTAAYLTMIGQLQALDTPAPALALLREAVTRFAPEGQTFLTQLFVFTCIKGSAEDGIALARDIDEPKAMLEALAALNVGEFIEPQDAEQNPRAEIAYLVGTQMSSVGHEAEAEKVYRYALSLQPDHSWAANNLGYLLLEQGRELPEAERLIELAWKKLPDSESVTDSLAWVRYKRGQFKDELGPDGGVVKEGALTLLDNAVNQLNGHTDWTILDHYGDVLFRTGKAGEARKAWAQCQALLKTVLQPPPRVANLPAPPESPLSTRQRELLRLVTQKLEDVDAGRPPAVAPTWSDQAPPAQP